MSQSSSASSSRSRGGGGGGYDGQGLPVPYRIGPLAYEPAVLFNYEPKVKACRWISWSQGQPGRRYYRCQRSRISAQDYGFFCWADDECSAWYKELLGDLRDAVWGLKKEVAKREAKVQAKDMQLVAMQMEVEDKKKEVEEKQLDVQVKQEERTAKQQQLQAKDEVVQALEAKLKSKNQSFDALLLLCVVSLIMFVVVLMYGKKA